MFYKEWYLVKDFETEKNSESYLTMEKTIAFAKSIVLSNKCHFLGALFLNTDINIFITFFALVVSLIRSDNC